MYHSAKVCRACGHTHLPLILDLGETALANDFLLPDQIGEYDRSFPLRLQLCPNCSLVQLAEVVNPRVLYSRYAYVTSNSKTMSRHLAKLSKDLLKAGQFTHTPRVVEFGSNTGRFLKEFQSQNCDVLGVEPAENISALAQWDNIPTRTEFFNEDSAKQIASDWGHADIIIGRHVFAHIDDWNAMVRAFSLLLKDKGIVAIEVPYLVDFYRGVEFDTVYHEHLSYVSVRAMMALVHDSPLQLERVLRYPIHGGSIVLVLRKRSARIPTHASVGKALREEASLQLDQPGSWKRFSKQVDAIRTELPALIRKLRAKGKRVIGYGASAKGNTLLNSCGLTQKDLDYIIDNTPFKQGKLAPGSWIPIHPPDYLLKDQPDYALILAWNFAKEILSREKSYQSHGGRFITPIPTPKIIHPAS